MYYLVVLSQDDYLKSPTIKLKLAYM